MISESEINSSIGVWKDTEFTIGETKFKVFKLSPSQAFLTLEKIRIAVSPALTGVQDDGIDGFAAILALLLKIDSGELQNIRDDLFDNIRFTNSMAQTETKLRGNIDMAFANLLPVNIYEVLGRALVINFLESFLDILRRGAAET